MARTLETIRNARVYSGPVGGSQTIATMTDHGLVSEFTLRFETDKKVLMDTSDGTGGAFATHYRVTTMTATMVAKEETTENLAIAFRATTAAGTTANDKVYSILAASPTERRLIVKGISEVNNGDVCELEIFRAKFSPAEEFQMISDDFADITLNLDVLTNPDATGLADKFATITVTKAPAV
jgi:hypothetical protein